MCNCCCNNNNYVEKYYYLKETLKEVLARQERNVEMMRELYEMLPTEKQKELKDTNWFENRCDEWTKQYREKQRKDRFI